MSSNPDEPRRLSKVVAALVPCSRSQAELYIGEGRVTVDGAVVEQPQARVAPGQRVQVDTAAHLNATGPVTLLLNKPAGLSRDEAMALLGGSSKWSADASGLHWLRRHGAGLIELLPLPAQAGGLVVCSQQRGVLRKLQEEGALVEQELLVDVTGTPAPDAPARLAQALAAHVSWQSEARLRIAGKALQLERLPGACEQVGLAVTGWRRIRIGRVAMARLPAGQWRYLGVGERF